MFIYRPTAVSGLLTVKINQKVPFDSHDPPVQPTSPMFSAALWADYIAHTHCVCTQRAWGAFSLCISAHTRVRNERHLDADSESDLHVNHSPPPDCSYWVKCGGNFMHGRSPSIIKQFFMQFRKKLYIPYQWLPNHVELWFHSFHEEQFITSFRQALLLPPFHFPLSLLLSTSVALCISCSF